MGVKNLLVVIIFVIAVFGIAIATWEKPSILFEDEDFVYIESDPERRLACAKIVMHVDTVYVKVFDCNEFNLAGENFEEWKIW